jgi:quercetin dioxygenase-like cupin family protein
MKKFTNSIRPYALTDGEGWTYRFGIDFTVKIGEVEGGSSVAVMEYITRKGEEPPGHTHHTEDEVFYVLDGALTFHCGGECFDLEKGGFVFLPHGIEHSYTIRRQEPVRLIIVTSPKSERGSGGWVGFVSDLEFGQGELIAKPEDPG